MARIYTTPEEQKIYTRIFYSLLVLFVMYKLFFVCMYNAQFMSNDEMIYWQATIDYSKGIFHEPYFYGQDYNIMVDSFVAVPLYKLGIPIQYAVPLGTMIVANFSFIFFSFVLKKHRYFGLSLIFLALPLCMPSGYDLLTSLPRGFVNGMVFLFPLIFPLLFPKKTTGHILFALSSTLAMVVNPNTVIVTAPLGVYLWLNNIGRIRFYIVVIAGALPAFFVKEWIAHFYAMHPGYNNSHLLELQFSFELLLKAFGHLDQFFSDLTPILWFGNWLVNVFILLIGIHLWRIGRQREAIATIFGVLCILAFMGINKVNDRVPSIYLSSVRMYLPIPFLFGMVLIWYLKNTQFTTAFYKVIRNGVLIMILIKGIGLSGFIERTTGKRSQSPIEIMSYSELASHCSEINKVAGKTDADLLYIVPTWENQFSYFEYFNYGCECIEKEFLPTIIAFGERRAWRYDEVHTMRPKTILFYLDTKNAIVDPDFQDQLIRVSDKYPLYLMTENDCTLEELSERYGFIFRRSFY